MTMSEAAAYCGVSPPTFRKMRKEWGIMTFCLIHSTQKRYVFESEMKRFIEELKSSATPECESK